MAFRRIACLVLSSILFFLAFPRFSTPTGAAQTRAVHERLRGVLSRAKLTPGLRADAAIRYSPDGRFLFVQDPVGIALLSRDPLRVVTYIDAPLTYPAKFSADSQTLILVTFDLFVTR